MNESTKQRLLLQGWYDDLSNLAYLKCVHSIPSNPTYIDLFGILKECGNEMPEVVVAIGGGSTIDMAKACVGLMYLTKKESFENTDVLNSIRSKEYLSHKSSIPIYAVPTTAGTGSEVTRWATVWNREEKVKYSVEAPWLSPKRAYIIADFTKTMSKRLTLSTGLDALCQAVESYWAKSSNQMVKILSKSAIEVIINYLPKVLGDLDNLYYREKMCLGSLFSGLAFANTRTTACHSISYPLSIRFGIEHGIACALTLAEVMKINFAAIEEHAQLMEALHVNSPDELQNWIDNLAGDVHKMRLSSFGIQEKDIDELVKLSFTQGRMDNNPVEITPGNVRKILIDIL